MKTKLAIAFLNVFLLFGSVLSAIGQAAETPPIRYFMQPESVKGSDTPYGNNPAVGHYVQADDAKIYYEVYGKGQPIFVFHGGGVGTAYEMGSIIDTARTAPQVVHVPAR